MFRDGFNFKTEITIILIHGINKVNNEHFLTVDLKNIFTWNS